MNRLEGRGNHMAKDILQQKIFIIVNGDSLESEEDIFVTRANCKDEALIQYADEYYAKNKYFKESIEDRAINMTFWEPFFSNIYYYENGEILTDLNDDEIEIKLKENIEEYLGEYKKFASHLISFYKDENKKLEELPEELIEYMAFKAMQEDKEYLIIKEL